MDVVRPVWTHDIIASATSIPFEAADLVAALTVALRYLVFARADPPMPSGAAATR